ncbi:MAG: hypothetical protein U1E65_20050 [Myxococcota bacterium]
MAELFGITPTSRLVAMSDEELLSATELLIRKQNLKKALAYLEVASLRNFDDPKAHERLAHLEQRAAQPQAAKKSQLRAAQGYLRRGQVPEASTVLKQLLMINKDCLEARLALGQIYEGKGEIEEAVLHYVEAVKILSVRRDYEGAQELLERVRQLQRVKNVLEGETEIGSRILMTPEEPSHTIVNSEVREDETQPPERFERNPKVVIAPELRDNPAEANTLIDFKFNASEQKTLMAARNQAIGKAPSVQLKDETEAVPVPSHEVGVHQPTDIIIREMPDVLVKFDTAVEYIKVQKKPLTSDLPKVTEDTARLSANAIAVARAQTALNGPRRGNSVWDRAIVKGPAEKITINVDPEPADPEATDDSGPGVLKKNATSGIGRAITGIISSMRSGDGGNERS